MVDTETNKARKTYAQTSLNVRRSAAALLSQVQQEQEEEPQLIKWITGGNKMSDTYSTANVAGKPTGKRYSGGGQVLGKTPELGEFVYKSHTKDQADMYLRTTDAIADYVGV